MSLPRAARCPRCRTGTVPDGYISGCVPMLELSTNSDDDGGYAYDYYVDDWTI